LRSLFFSLLFLVTIQINYAQELNCQVQIVSQQIEGTDKRVFDVLKSSIVEFMNSRKWTSDVFKNNERIDCNILINITKRIAIDEFEGTVEIQSRRPVYKASYNSLLFNFNDNDFHFKYQEGQPLDFIENTYTSNLTSVLAYYAYLIIGLDYDSFSLKGGTPYLQKALAVDNNAQGSSETGWKAFDGTKNRYWIINNLLDATFIPIREAMYKYHRLGLDVMVSDQVGARKAILESLENLKQIHEIKPLSFSMQVFFNAKADEIINIFSSATTDEKSKVLEIVNLIDPTNSNKYQKINGPQ
jgi:Domain of unknown function (DUF4835)